MSAHTDARNELNLKKIIDHGLIQCPEDVSKCFYYPKRQCIGGKYGITYTITGCLRDHSFCEEKAWTTNQLNNSARCCKERGCNLVAYDFMRSLPRWEPQHDFCGNCNQCKHEDKNATELSSQTNTTVPDRVDNGTSLQSTTTKSDRNENSETATSAESILQTSTPSSTPTTFTTTKRSSGGDVY
ncbi:hypothetical protein V3C99_011113 [Haemonchus contortus]